MGDYIAITEIKPGDIFKKYEIHWKVVSVEYESKGTIELNLEKHNNYPHQQVIEVVLKRFRKTTKVLRIAEAH